MQANGSIRTQKTDTLPCRRWCGSSDAGSLDEVVRGATTVVLHQLHAHARTHTNTCVTHTLTHTHTPMFQAVELVEPCPAYANKVNWGQNPLPRSRDTRHIGSLHCARAGTPGYNGTQTRAGSGPWNAGRETSRRVLLLPFYVPVEAPLEPCFAHPWKDLVPAVFTRDQDFHPKEGTYDCIWAQYGSYYSDTLACKNVGLIFVIERSCSTRWVLGHLIDEDLVDFLKRCHARADTYAHTRTHPPTLAHTRARALPPGAP